MAFGLDVYAYTSKKTHVNICYPYQGEASYQVAAPVVEEQLKICDCNEAGCDIMREAILARKDVEELTTDNRPTILAALKAIRTRFEKDILMCYRPCNRCNG